MKLAEPGSTRKYSNHHYSDYACLLNVCSAPVRVTDGDTIIVLDSAVSRHKIRLTGIDAPERKQAFGNKSKEHLSDRLAWSACLSVRRQL